MKDTGIGFKDTFLTVVADVNHYVTDIVVIFFQCVNNRTNFVNRIKIFNLLLLEKISFSKM